MEYTIHTDHIELTDLDSEALNKKLDRLEKHLKPPFRTSVSFRRNIHHRTGDIVSCSITIDVGKKTFHTERTSETLQDSLDEAIHALKRELEKEHDKAKDEHRG